MEKSYAHPIEEIFSGNYFAIPDYQRGYAWDKEQCLDLLNDLEVLPVNFEHYTGTIVLHPNGNEIQDEEGVKYKSYDIVDGQQRITSIVILLNVIQTFFSNHPSYVTLASGISKRYLSATRLDDKNPFYKLTLNADCKDFFKSDILGQKSVIGPTIRSHLRLLTAHSTFNEYITAKQEELQDDFYPWLLDYYNKIVHKLQCGIYIVDSSAEVGVIFEVMNNRGKELTELEKTKNYLLYLATKINITTVDKLVTNINNTWSSIYKQFMASDFGNEVENQFLRAHWLMFADYSKKEWDGSKSIKGKYNLKSYQNHDLQFLNDLTNYIKSLNDSAICYTDIEKPERETSFNSILDVDEKQAIKFYSIKLIRTKTIASFRPLLIACRLRYPNDGASYLALIKLLEKYAFRVYNMHERRSDTGQSALYKIAYELFHVKISLEEALLNIRWLIREYSSQASFTKFWTLDESDNNFYHWNALKYMLYEYEEYLAKKNQTTAWSHFSEKKLENTIEHILPQTYEDKENYWPQRFNPEEVKLFIHDLGNLCLTYDNSSYRNFDFVRKKGVPGQEARCYSNSGLFQERALASYPEWNKESILHRRNLITTWALSRWYVDFSDLENSKSADETEELEELVENEISAEETK